jgi:FkbM family methyltransferase
MNDRIVNLPGGVRVAIQPPLHQQKQWLKGRYYEAPMLAHIRKHYRGGTFIDGGACIGNHTLFFAAFCAEQVLAVEPVERNMAHLLTNVRLSGLQDKVTPVRAALGAAQGRGAMLHAGQMHGEYNLVEGDAVDVTTLDALMELCRDPVTVVKLDIQWTEIAALRGGLALLERDRPALFIELMTPEELSEADNILERFGYVRTLRFGGSPTYEYVRKNG